MLIGVYLRSSAAINDFFTASQRAGMQSNAPTTMYSTPFEFNNSRNSRQSLFSGMGVTAVAEFDKDIQALLSRHRRVVARVGLIGCLEAGKCPCRFLHAHIIARRLRLPGGNGDSASRCSSSHGESAG